MISSWGLHPTVAVIIRRLRRRLAGAGWNQLQLAEAVSRGPLIMHYTYLNKLLAGKKDIKVEHLAAMLSALGVSPADFFLEVAQALGHPRRLQLSGEAASALERSVVSEVRDQVEP